jgi:xanthine dehydrogenase small subunit
LLAGSTEVGLQVNKQFSTTGSHRVLGQCGRAQADQRPTPQAWHIGAVVSLTEVEGLVAKAYPDFAEVLRRFGSPPFAHTATLAGNIANGSPIGDTMPCLMALGHHLGACAVATKTRTVALGPVLHRPKAKRSCKLVSSSRPLRLPKPHSRRQVFRAHKVSKRFEQDISATCAAISLQP